MEESSHDFSLPYDSSITSQILDVIDFALTDKNANIVSSKSKSKKTKEQTKISRKLRVEINTDIDKTKTQITLPNRAVLDTNFLDYIWLRIVELFSSQNESELDGNDFDQNMDKWGNMDQFAGDPGLEFFAEEDDPLLDPEAEFETVDDDSDPDGFNISISLVSESGSYFISSYFEVGGEILDLAKLIVDNNDKKGKKSVRNSGIKKNQPFFLKISLASIDGPISTNRFDE